MDFNIAGDAAGINKSLFQITHGLYILTAMRGERRNGQALDALMQVTNMPSRVAIGVGLRNFTHDMIRETGLFTINVLDREDPAVYDRVKHFGFQSGKNVDKFASVNFETGANGLPILPEAKAFFECRVIPEKTIDLQTHTIFIGLVERSGVRAAGEPLTYNEYRKTLKKG